MQARGLITNTFFGIFGTTVWILVLLCIFWSKFTLVTTRVSGVESCCTPSLFLSDQPSPTKVMENLVFSLLSSVGPSWLTKPQLNSLGYWKQHQPNHFHVSLVSIKYYSKKQLATQAEFGQHEKDGSDEHDAENSHKVGYREIALDLQRSLSLFLVVVVLRAAHHRQVRAQEWQAPASTDWVAEKCTTRAQFGAHLRQTMGEQLLAHRAQFIGVGQAVDSRFPRAIMNSSTLKCLE